VKHKILKFINSICKREQFPKHSERSITAPIYKKGDVTVAIIEAGIVEPEETSIARKRFGKHVPFATNMQATIDILFETIFSIRSVQSVYKRRELRFR
jgi:hypothetical protein